MSDFSNWSKWIHTLYDDLLELSYKMSKSDKISEQRSFRKEYIHKCEEWLRINDVMRQRITYAKERTEQQLNTIEIIVRKD